VNDGCELQSRAYQMPGMFAQRKGMEGGVAR
jgi:hypothetical protein